MTTTIVETVKLDPTLWRAGDFYRISRANKIGFALDEDNVVA